MNVEIRIYKRFDTDILALHDAGFSIMRMMHDSLIAYATGKPFHILLEEMIPFKISDKSSIRTRLTINESVPEVKALLNAIKRGYRSNFCKQLLRNSIIQQNLPCYIDDTSFFSLHEKNAASFGDNILPGTVPSSMYRQKRVFTDVSGTEHEIKQKTGKKIRKDRTEIEAADNKAAAPSLSAPVLNSPVEVNGQWFLPVNIGGEVKLVPVPGSPSAQEPAPEKAQGWDTKTVKDNIPPSPPAAEAVRRRHD